MTDFDVEISDEFVVDVPIDFRNWGRSEKLYLIEMIVTGGKFMFKEEVYVEGETTVCIEPENYP